MSTHVLHLWYVDNSGDASVELRAMREEYRAMTTGSCPLCNGGKPPLQAIDLHLDHIPYNRPLGCVPLIAQILRFDFIDAIGRDIVFEHCHIGKVFDDKGRLWPNFASVRGKHLLTIRGDATSKYRQCTGCGRHVYFAMGKWHLLRSRLMDVPIYRSDAGPLIMSDDICQRLRTQKWKKVRFTKLPVLDKPLDGLDDLPL